MKRGNGLEGAPLEGAPDQRGWSVKHGNNLGGVVPDGARPERRLSVDGPVQRGNRLGGALLERWKRRTSMASAGGSEAGTPDECAWIVKRGNSLRGAPLGGSDANMQSWWHGFFGQFPSTRLP